MEDTKQTPNEPVQPLSPEQAAEVAGGDGTCSTSTISVNGTSVTSGGSLTDVAIGTYDAAVAVTSYAIERVVKAL